MDPGGDAGDGAAVPVSGVCLYYLSSVRVGTPHGGSFSVMPDNGNPVVAFVHTHPNSEDFSPIDKQSSTKWNVLAYVATPSYSLKKYDPVQASTIFVNSFTPRQLNNNEKRMLEKKYRQKWINHINQGCRFNCINLIWPTS